MYRAWNLQFTTGGFKHIISRPIHLPPFPIDIRFYYLRLCHLPLGSLAWFIHSLRVLSPSGTLVSLRSLYQRSTSSRQASVTRSLSSRLSSKSLPNYSTQYDRTRGARRGSLRWSVRIFLYDTLLSLQTLVMKALLTGLLLVTTVTSKPQNKPFNRRQRHYLVM